MNKSITKYIIILMFPAIGLLAVIAIFYFNTGKIANDISLLDRGQYIQIIYQQFYVVAGVVLLSTIIAIWVFTKFTRQQLQNEQTLRKSEQHCHSIIDMAPDGIITINEQGRIESFSKAAEIIFGYHSEDVIGQNINCLMPEPFRTEHDGYLRRYQQTGVSHLIGTGPREVICKRCDGSTFPAGLTVNQMVFEDKIQYIGIIRDITLRKQRDEKLYEIDKRFALIVNGTRDGIWDWDLTTGKIYFSPRWKQMLGYEEEEVADNFMALQNLVHEDDLGTALEAWINCMEGITDNFSVEYRIKSKQDGYLWVLCRGISEFNQQGHPIRMAGSHSDITRRKIDFDELQELAAELAAKAVSLAQINSELDQFAYVTSHDLKAPLRAIANLSLWIEEDLQQVMTDDTRNQMKLLRGRVNRMEGLINGILAYSRIGRVDLEIEEIDIGKMLSEILESLAPSECFQINIAKNMPVLTSAAVPLSQVFSNLLSNAIKYNNRSDGHITVSVSEITESGLEQETGISIGMSNAYYEFCVADDGPGIAPEYHDKVFQIFQTLQARDTVESTGVGLTLVKKIVEQLGGQIKLESEEGKGAKFIFTIPKSFPEETGASQKVCDARRKAS